MQQTTFEYGRTAAGVWLTRGAAVKIAEEWRALSARFPEIAQGLLGGMTRKQIAAKLRWDVRSLNKVLREPVAAIRAVAHGQGTTRRLYKKATP